MLTSQIYSVWAPLPQDVRLIVNGQTHPMTRKAGGWWRADVTAQAGDRYGFSLFDGSSWSKPLPDPRSRQQPDGIHDLSAIPEDSYLWEDQQWTGRILPGSVLYELHVGSFSPQGNFEGVVDKLPYLRDLGVTAIELMPVQPFGGNRNWGYDGVLWHAVHEGYGGPAGLKALVDASHQAGIAVYLDVVYNHFGPDGNYNGQFGPYTAGGSTGWGDVVNINGHDSNEVRSYILDAARQWFEDFHIDGLRLDAVHSFDDRGAYSLLEQLAVVAEDVSAQSGIPRSLIAESDLNDHRIVASREAGGCGVDAQWVDDIHHALHALVSGETNGYYCDFGTVETLATTLAHVFEHTGNYSTFRGRNHGRPVRVDVTPSSRFVTYTTTHDQTGNRATGDRPSMSLTPEQQVLKAAIIYSSPYTPMLFMGEEYGAQTPFAFFCSHTDDELNRLTSEGRKREFARLGWNADEIPTPHLQSTYESSKLDWEFAPEQQRINDAYKQLLRLRHTLGFSQPNLLSIDIDHGEKWLSMANGRGRIVANFSDDTIEVPFGGELIYSFTSPRVTANSTTLQPWSFAILQR
ncbi:Malto-oligosyltrehalose trehalohydrolase [Corynebacterium deserti GIMN1.010]|uniref:Malto-oligosyltrehalose trehalohydrolase n=1 Tax=Corynebacterium deserti GIMN1.010 TaxID=931089 RepID=A0A0M3Q9X3_9CORY|nr:malto-oligosyltrehalose trehalohydrolase [Corynebacterium deserti]ALC06303.1 Malto-oligosyltrehalose trehalohydrolase [Corynebacterium deserti GIMN1.010]